MHALKHTARFVLCCLALPAVAESYSYQAISQRYSGAQLNAAALNDAKMQGECLVGLKQLNFKRRGSFDPVAEWTNYRSLSSLEQFPPCEVLVMMEVARSAIIKLEPPAKTRP